MQHRGVLSAVGVYDEAFTSADINCVSFRLEPNDALPCRDFLSESGIQTKRHECKFSG